MMTTDSLTIDQYRYPIRTVASLTGVNPITLRAWERRYGLMTPYRTAKGHRLYSQQDIDLICRVVDLLEAGIPISQVKQALCQRSAQGTEVKAENMWGCYLQHMLVAISRLDEACLEATYNEVLSLYSIDVFTNKLILPLLQLLGKRWENTEGSVAEEHFFSVYLRNKLGARFHHHSGMSNGFRLLCACVSGEYHEFGLLFFALAANAQGYETVVLGANIPLQELPLATKRSHSHAIVLSSRVSSLASVLTAELPQLVKNVNVPVWIGGQGSSVYHDEIMQAGAIPLGEDICQGLKCIHQQFTTVR
ncbi:MerR family transcriptional regulator [Beggiatoa leptomitoformis]|uniref:MerR family transcriptional regulator n=1 Tax=Beggiatoa leptomitoformis TaxID=288004 RepID=A0A2N9YBC5_9GAMM|nr:MerR family transcriptional regulator [Beggiatoa leptomitoformis]ALG66881.2 MerR family transcriptional regulator [Beggiatoa leptomitoformis]AUI67761.2 MerR family transcriptional regulator [Beggiatoa leptomitoformis]